MIPRPVRNNNPGDLCSGAPWEGLASKDQMTPEQLDEPRFCVFTTPAYGFRALVLLLRNYYTIYQCRTVDEFIRRFAPPGENPTTAYASEVAHECGVGPFEPIHKLTSDFMFKLAKAITRFESGSWEPYWHDADLIRGMEMVGIVYPGPYNKQVAA